MVVFVFALLATTVTAKFMKFETTKSSFYSFHFCNCCLLIFSFQLAPMHGVEFTTFDVKCEMATTKKAARSKIKWLFFGSSNRIVFIFSSTLGSVSHHTQISDYQ